MVDSPGLHHVMIAIPAGKEAPARHFYGELLGLREIEKPESLRGRGGVWFAAGAVQLHLGVDPEFRPATKAHIALLMASVDRVRDTLRANGFAVQPDDLLPGFERYYVDDPFGNRVEIMEPLRGA